MGSAPGIATPTTSGMTAAVRDHPAVEAAYQFAWSDAVPGFGLHRSDGAESLAYDRFREEAMRQETTVPSQSRSMSSTSSQGSGPVIERGLRDPLEALLQPAARSQDERVSDRSLPALVDRGIERDQDAAVVGCLMPDLKFDLGFRAVADELGAAVVGTPLEPEQPHPGGTYQTTTTGLMLTSRPRIGRCSCHPRMRAVVAPPPPPPPPEWAPTVLSRPSPNHGGVPLFDARRRDPLHQGMRRTTSYSGHDELVCQPGQLGCARRHPLDGHHRPMPRSGRDGLHDPSTNRTHLGVELCQSKLAGRSRTPR